MVVCDDGNDVELTIFHKTGGILSKRIRLTESGEIDADGSECRMSKGQAYRKKLNGPASLAELIEAMPSEQALALGRLRADLPDVVQITRKQDLDASSPGTIARTGDYLYFAPGKPAYMLLDHDRKGISDAVRAKLKAAGGFWKAMTEAIPGLAGGTRVTRRSASASLYHEKKANEPLSQSMNRHTYVLVKDGSDIARALKTLQDRLWLAGYGYFVVGAAGQLLVRSIIDAAVGGPERLVFEGAPELVPPVAQDAEKRRARATPGTSIDTARAIPPLTEQESAQLAELKAQVTQRLEGEVAAKRKVWAAVFAKRHGLSEKEAERIASQAVKHVLEDNFELTFDDPGLDRRTVAEVVAEPDKYAGETLADPLEGVGYGRNKAKVLRQRNRELIINSFAHGGITYRLAGQGTKLTDFQAHLPSHKYIYVPAREPWPAASVNAAVGPVTLLDSTGAPLLDDKGNPITVVANQWLDSNQCVEQMTWAPGLPLLIEDRLIAEGGWIVRPGVTSLNLYRPPRVKPGDPDEAAPWIEHVQLIYPDDAAHIIDWQAHCVQHPDVKINHALVLGGSQGIGKDTLLEPVKQAVGPWNFIEVTPRTVMGTFTAFVRSVILRISEARDLGDFDRYKFYDHMKIYTAAPPDVLRVNEKHLAEYAIPNVCNAVVTTNHRTDGIYLPADDRRHYVAWSEARKEDFDQEYWNRLWRWYRDGGIEHVAAFLMQRDLSQFDPKAPPRKTEAFHAMVASSRNPEDAEMADALDKLGNPDAVIITQLVAKASRSFSPWLQNRANARQISYRLDACGYVAMPNRDAKDGQWRLDGERRTIYVRGELSMSDRVRAVDRFIKAFNEAGKKQKGRNDGGE